MYIQEAVRKAHLKDNKSKRAIARELGLSRNTVKKLLDAKPGEIPVYRQTRRKARPVLGPYEGIINSWLESDKQAPVKQRHTAKKIFDRLKDEYGFSAGERTVREYVAKVKAKPREVFLPLQFQPGEMAQVDWAEVQVILKGVQTRVYLFSMILNYSGAHYFETFERQNQESFFQGHVNAFSFFGGVPRTLTYDNLKSAVEKVLRGKSRKENDGFVAFRSAWLFDSRFCNPARGNEKGRVENMIKFAQRNFFTPVPDINSLEELNALLYQRCLDYWKTVQARQSQTVEQRLREEMNHFLPLPAYPPECCRILPVTADKSALIQFETNRYSVPSEYAYKLLWLKTFVNQIEITDQEKVIATHSRLKGRFEESIRFEHYRKVLKRKPGALEHLRASDKEPPPEKIGHSLESPYPKTTVQPPNLTIYRQLFRRQDHDPIPHAGNLPQETAPA